MTERKLKHCDKCVATTEHVKYKSSRAFQCNPCQVARVSERRKELKRMAVKYKGGKCERCGYDKCIAALEFHHRDPNAKEFQVTACTTSWQRMKAEVDKCDLVCSNCHKELHYGS